MKLNLAYNKLKSVVEVADLKHLEDLNVSNNEITDLPTNLTNLPLKVRSCRSLFDKIGTNFVIDIELC